MRFNVALLTKRLEKAEEKNTELEKAIIVLDKSMATLTPLQSHTNMGERISSNVKAGEDALNRRITELAQELAVVKDRSDRAGKA